MVGDFFRGRRRLYASSRNSGSPQSAILKDDQATAEGRYQSASRPWKLESGQGESRCRERRRRQQVARRDSLYADT